MLICYVESDNMKAIDKHSLTINKLALITAIVVILGTCIVAKYKSTYSLEAQNKHKLLREARLEDISEILIEPSGSFSLTNHRIL